MTSVYDYYFVDIRRICNEQPSIWNRSWGLWGRNFQA